MLFLIYINVIVKHIRSFFTTKDISIDDMLTSYYYKNNTYNKMNNTLLTEKTLDFVDFSDITFIFDIRNEIISYIRNDFNIKVVLYPTDFFNVNLLKKMYIRYQMITLYILINIYLYYNFDKYIIIFFNKFHIELIFFSSFFTIMLCFLQQKILYKNNVELFYEIRFYKIIFFILVFLGFILFFFIVLKNKIILNPNEIIFEFNNIIKIIENFCNRK